MEILMEVEIIGFEKWKSGGQIHCLVDADESRGQVGKISKTYRYVEGVKLKLGKGKYACETREFGKSKDLAIIGNPKG